MITVTQKSARDPLAFEVVVEDDSGRSRHRVTLAEATATKFAKGVAPERLVEAAFRFLLDREPKESILQTFDLGVIARYFPEFERELPRYLAAGA